jgi:hypothetical protein
MSLTLRRDGSSRFGINNKYGLFPAVSVGWNLGREDFMSNVDFVSDLKFRASWGQTGNDQIGNFDSRGLVGSTRAYNGGAGIGPTQLSNPDLKWEVRQEFNVGLDFGFFNNRLTGSIDAYKRDNKDVLLNKPLYQTTGFDQIAQNVGSIRNQGVEFAIRGRILDGDFKWTSSFNISYNYNKVTGLYDTLTSLPSDPSIKIGESLQSWFVVPFAGVNPATGRPMWRDINNNLTYFANAADWKCFSTTNMEESYRMAKSTSCLKSVVVHSMHSRMFMTEDGQPQAKLLMFPVQLMVMQKQELPETLPAQEPC